MAKTVKEKLVDLVKPEKKKEEVKQEVKDERDPDLPDNKQRWLR